MEDSDAFLRPTFVRYPKIPATSYTQLRTPRHGAPNAPNAPRMRWIATEKIHGCNLGLSCTVDGIVGAQRRNGLLADTESFHGLRESPLFARLVTQVRELAGRISFDRQITVFGELYGGGKSIQPKIHYADDLRFAAFDLVIDDRLEEPFLAHLHCTAVGIPWVPVVAEASHLHELELPDVETAVSAVSERGDVVEGFVVREKSVYYDLTELRDRGARHTILKVKRAAFRERNRAPAQVEADSLLTTAQGFVTAARLETVRTKEAEGADHATLTRALAEDALEDFLAAEGARWDKTPAKVQKRIQKSVRKKAGRLVRSPV